MQNGPIFTGFSLESFTNIESPESAGWSPESYNVNASSSDVGEQDSLLELLLTPPSSVTYDMPKLQILEQPKELFRFRYLTESQGPPHGAIVGASATKSSRSFPTVKLCNFNGEAVIRCWLIADNVLPTPHVHRLVTRVGSKEIKEEPHDIVVNETNHYTASFENLVIIHAVRKTCYEHYMKKKHHFSINWESGRTTNQTNAEKKDLNEMKKDISKMNMNIARLYFEALVFVNGQFQRIAEAISHPIKNKKNSEYGDLKISRSDKISGSPLGGDEVFIFVEKVQKDIKIKFYEEDDFGEIIWSEYALFSPLDIHHLVAIAFRTPAYKDPFITSPVKVKYLLERPKDAHVSNSMDFTYLPIDSRHSAKRSRFEQPSKRPPEISLEKLLEEQDLTSFLNEQIFDFNELRHLPECLMADSSKSEETLKIWEKLSNQIHEAVNMTDISNGQNFEAEEVSRLLELATLIDGNSILHLAVIMGSERLSSVLSTIKALHLQPLLNKKNFQDETPLHLAVRFKRPSTVKMLLAAEADPNVLDGSGESSLHVSSYLSPECSALILDCPLTDPYLKNSDGETAMHLAVKNKQIECLRRLLEAQVSPNVSSAKNGDTPLHLACCNNFREGARLLIEFKADVNALNLSGYSPLHLCVSVDNLELAQTLAEHGAFVDFSHLETSPSPDMLEVLTRFCLTTHHDDSSGEKAQMPSGSSKPKESTGESNGEDLSDNLLHALNQLKLTY